MVIVMVFINHKENLPIGKPNFDKVVTALFTQLNRLLDVKIHFNTSTILLTTFVHL